MPDIRRLLEREVERVSPPSYSTAEIYRRRNRRQRARRVGVALLAFAVLGGGILGLWATFRAQERVPATRPTPSDPTTVVPGATMPKVTTAINGMTITYPRDWFLHDPDGQRYEFPHDTLLLLTEREPDAIGWVSLDRLLRGQACDEQLPGMVLIVEEVLPGEGSGEDYGAWPVSLRPRGSPCPPGLGLPAGSLDGG